MTTYLLLHGAGCDGWHWHRVAPLLEARGHTVVAPDLPVADDDAGLDAHVDAAVDGVSGDDVVIVAQSLGGIVAPLAAERLDAREIVLVNAMVPQPGETLAELWTNTGFEFPDPFDEVDIFLHDVPQEIVDAGWDHVVEQRDGMAHDPCPLDAWPDVPTRAIVGTGDRFFTPDFQTRVLRERLGLEPELIDSGHCPALACPERLVELVV